MVDKCKLSQGPSLARVIASDEPEDVEKKWDIAQKHQKIFPRGAVTGPFNLGRYHLDWGRVESWRSS